MRRVSYIRTLVRFLLASIFLNIVLEDIALITLRGLAVIGLLEKNM